MASKLPIGIQSFQKIINEDYIYVDKTEEALDLIDNYTYVFLSRPRRFGKSLFVDTLNEIFSGNKELFKGLHIYDKYDFEPYPVIRIDWSGNFKTQKSTVNIANEIMHRNQERLNIKCRNTSPDLCFQELIIESYEKYGKKVVILIDEYDKPILDNLDDFEQAKQRRDFLRGLYVQMKSNDAYIRFAFLTGISKFSKASIFSGLNNILDISLHHKFATICGYTQRDLEEKFGEKLQGADMEKIKEWYNGYNFIGEPVYNPFDILLFIDHGLVFDNYWWQSGNPFSLIELLKKGNYYIPELENLEIDSMLLNSFDIEQLRLESLLFQAGYLTIDKIVRYEFFDTVKYKLKVPNKEVQFSLNRLFYEYLTGEFFSSDSDLMMGLYEGKIEKLKEKLQQVFSGIPYNNYVKNNISNFEGYYASVVYAYLAGMGVITVAEDVSSKGRIDLTMFIGDKIFIIEFKVGEGNALQQIKDKQYYKKYLDRSKEIYLIGINFDEKEKNITRFEWEKLNL